MKSAIACENLNLNLQCPSGKWLFIVDANYGRTNSNVCCKPGMPCGSNSCRLNLNSLASVKCNTLNSCTILATNDLSGDPCPGIFKYLEVFYKCIWSYEKQEIQKKLIE